jgi:hypothetical protein
LIIHHRSIQSDLRGSALANDVLEIDGSRGRSACERSCTHADQVRSVGWRGQDVIHGREISARHRLRQSRPARPLLGRRAWVRACAATRWLRDLERLLSRRRGTEEDLSDGADRISDPHGHGPNIWFHLVPEAKIVKNRLHLDIHASGERADPIEARKHRVDAEARRLVALGATTVGALMEDGILDHYAVGMKDPEGNEFDIN